MKPNDIVMKYIFLSLATILSLGAVAQTTVTLTVDMSNETVSADGVHVAGNFQGWQAGDTPMTDNGDGTWSHTFTSDSAASYQYKFINGNAWGFEESVPDACAVDGNRQITVDGMMGESSSTTCFKSCAACGMTTVLFRVDMSNEEVSDFGVHIAGDFQGWEPGSTELTDADGDMVYEYVHTFEPEVDSVEYKFINGNAWTDVNEFLDGDCANVSGNRVLQFGNDANIVLSANGVGDAYCFNTCSSCILPLQVTFTVDMSLVSSVSDQGVHIAGTFQGWDAESTMLTDNGDGTWSTTLEVAPGAHQFKFINGAGWNGGEENMNGTSCNEWGNRGAVFDANNSTYSACFNLCPEDACLPDPDAANLTFHVDANDVDMMGESMYVFGAFTGWQGGAIEMTDNGDGTWQTTQLVSGSANVDYKYSIGAPSDQGNDESGTYILAGDSITFEMAGCGISNGFGGYNRRFVRSGMDEVIPLHCFNRCGACLTVLGCTDPGASNYDTAANSNDGSCQYDCPLEPDQPTGLFFSEYVEGLLNNKALEIFNPTSDFIDLSDYQIERYSNGATSSAANQRVALSGVLAPQDVVVCVLDKRDPDGVDFEAPVLEALAEKADLWLCPIYDENNAMYFNGNDALVLRKISTNAVIDVIGKVGEDPGPEGWAGLTQNHTLVRKAFVTQGDQNAVDNFLVVDEWSSISWAGDGVTDNLDVVFENLGLHGYCFGTNGTVGGCTDPSAFNFDPAADVDDGSCTYFESSCAAIGAPEWEAFELGLYAPTALLHTAGQSVTQEVVLHLPSSIDEAGAGTTYAVAEWSGLEVMGMPAGLAFDNLADTISGGSQTCLTYSGVPTAAGTYEVTMTGELFLSVFGNPVSAGMVEASLVITIEANGNAVFGCTYPHALNFNPVANDDDGSCAFAGCTDPSAENFEPYASVDDGTCETGPCVASCLGDLNNDGTIGSADLLTLLTTFGGDCE